MKEKDLVTRKLDLLVPILLAIVVVVLRVQFHPSPDLHPLLASEVPTSWWASLFNTHDWLLQGFDEGEWLGLVNAYLDGTTSHLTRPPAYPMSAAALALLVGNRVLALHLVTHIASILVCMATYFFGTRLTNRFVGVGAALLMATAPSVLRVQQEIGAFPVLVLANLCLAIMALRTARHPGMRQGALLGLAAAFAITAHYTSAPFAVIVIPLVVLGSGLYAFRPLLLTAGVAIAVAWAVYHTVPAQPVHSGGVTMVQFYEHALNHPDGRGLNHMPEPVAEGKQKHHRVKPKIFSRKGAAGRTLLKGPAAAFNSMTHDYGPRRLAPLVMGLMLLGIFWPGEDRDSVRLARWRPALWLLAFIGPLIYAAPPLADTPDHRYLSFALPFSAVAFVRGLDCLGRRLGRGWKGARVLAAVPVGLIVIQVGVSSAKKPEIRHMNIQRHVLAQEIVRHFGDGEHIIGANGQVGTISAYGALTRRAVCTLGSSGGICLDGHTVREDLVSCIDALLAECVDDSSTPYVMDMLPEHHLSDPITRALHHALRRGQEPVLAPTGQGHRVLVYGLTREWLQALRDGPR